MRGLVVVISFPIMKKLSSLGISLPWVQFVPLCLSKIDDVVVAAA